VPMVKKFFDKLKPYLRLRAFDVATAEGQDRERNRVALLSMITNAGSKGTAMLLVIAGVAWTVPYLGQERFGAWMAILSMATVLSFLDFGVGNSLTNHVIRAKDQGRPVLISAVTGGLAIVALISVGILIVLNFLHPFVPWVKLFKTNSETLLLEIDATVRLFYFLFSVLLFSNAVIKIYAGLQKAHLANISQIIAFSIALGLLYFSSEYQFQITYLLAITLGPVCVVGLFLSFDLYRQGLLECDSVAAKIRDNASNVLSVGGLFFVLQLAVIVGWGSDSMIISSALGVAAVAPFAVAQRIFQFVSQPFAILNAPFWPAYADAKAKGNYAYTQLLFKRSFMVSIVGGGIGVASLALVGSWLISELSNQVIVVDKIFIWIFAAWVLMEIVGNSLAMYLNGMGIIKLQVRLALIFVSIVIPLKLWVIHPFGISGLVAANVLVYFCVLVLPYLALYRAGRLTSI